MLKDVTNTKELPALLVFSEAIRYLKGHLTDMMSKQGFTLGDDDVGWVLTVPAIWDDGAKQFMREAAEKVRNQLLV